jgi:hypothetical protein
MAHLIGTKVRDEFGIWTICADDDGNLFARQGDTEVLLLDPSDFARFGLELAR